MNFTLQNKILFNRGRRMLAVAVICSMPFSFSGAALAQSTCETGLGNADTQLEGLASDAVSYINAYIQEVGNFIKLDVSVTAKKELELRIGQFGKNLYPPLFAWWLDDTGAKAGWGRNKALKEHREEGGESFLPDVLMGGDADGDVGNEPETQPPEHLQGDKDHSTLPALRAMARQLSVVKLLQAMHIGFFVDVRIMNEKIQARRTQEAETRAAFAPNLLSCQLETLNTGVDGSTSGSQIRAYSISRAFAHVYALEDMKRRNNYLKKPKEKPALAQNISLVRSAHAAAEVTLGGKPQQIFNMWEEYEQCFCDKDRGDQGCPEVDVNAELCQRPDTLRGKQTDIPSMLWHEDQTLNHEDPDVRMLHKSAAQTLIAPFAPGVIPRELLNTAVGKQEVMRRRAYDGRVNTIYHVVMQLMAERAGGSGGRAEVVSGAAGVTNAATQAGGTTGGGTSSYAAFRDAVTKHRFFQPDYAALLVDKPSTIISEQNRIGAAQTAIWNDTMSRLEERLFMEAASLGVLLDNDIPAPSLHVSVIGE